MDLNQSGAVGWTHADVDEDHHLISTGRYSCKSLIWKDRMLCRSSLLKESSVNRRSITAGIRLSHMQPRRGSAAGPSACI